MTPPRPNPEEPPPIMGTWLNVYLLLVAQLVVTILVFAAVSWWAS